MYVHMYVYNSQAPQNNLMKFVCKILETSIFHFFIINYLNGIFSPNSNIKAMGIKLTTS